ncbi:MAG TPA: hypothetical protein VF765_14340 [Polyangiaceae bacterium]
MKRESLTATLVLVVLAAAPIVLALAGQDAFAQTKPKKKGAKPAASASAAPTDTAPPADTTPPAAPTPSAAPEEAPSASASALPNTPPEAAADDSTNTEEQKNTKYYFVGLRYRGNLVPQFLENLFVDDGGTVYSNYIGIELDMRSDGHSTIPWIAFANYGFGDTLFHEKGKPDLPQNYSDVKSGLNAIYLGLDELWSTPLDEKHHWDFEYGFGVGIGVVFGTLNNDWVYLDDTNGTLAGTNGHKYSACPGPGNTLPVPTTTQPGNANPCDPGAHNNSQDTKTGNYQEKNWFSGGSIPTIFPYIAFPDIGVRWKPVKQFESRLHLGFSLTGFWFGISGAYGLEKPPEGEKKSGYVSGARGTL